MNIKWIENWHFRNRRRVKSQKARRKRRFICIILTACQTWTLTKALEQRLVTCEMKCLRKAVSKTRRDLIRNKVVREMVGTTPVLHHIE